MAIEAYKIGEFVVSIAGHDKGDLLIVIGRDGDALLLADGKRRTVEHPKRKKEKHVTHAGEISTLAEAIETGRVTNEKIKRECKQYQKSCQEK